MIGVGVGLAVLKKARFVGANLLASPTDLTTASWTKTNVGVTGQKVAETAVTGVHSVSQAYAKDTQPRRYLLTMHIDPVERTDVTCAVSFGTSGAYVTYNTNTRVVVRAMTATGSAQAHQATIAADPTNALFSVVTLEFTTTADTSLTVTAELYNAATSYLGVAGSGVNIKSITLQEVQQ